MDNTVQVFKARLQRLLKEAKEGIDRERARDRTQTPSCLGDVYFGRADALQEVISWAGILVDEK